LIEEARRAARRMIVSHRAHLDALASKLLENEVLDREAIERIMAGVPRLERRPGVGLRVVAAAVPAAPSVAPAPVTPAAMPAGASPAAPAAPEGS
jgi:hypothetical protein